MSEQTEVKSDALPDLDDLLQCPVCYEIPSGQIFQCNEGHHVCGRCKMRLQVCPVCRALFFGTRNYAMEELIANVKKLRAFKLGGKVTTAALGSNSSTPAQESTVVTEDESVEEEASDLNSNSSQIAPQACKGLFRCMSCKNGNSVRLPSARLLNHLRYYHAPELIEGTSENGEYLQAWQFSTIPGRIVTAVRVADMGIFFLIIEISNDQVCAWLTMAASPWVAQEFCYTVTISGNDREAIFSDCVWSVRSCEGSLKKRGHCLIVNGADARALAAPTTLNGKLSVRRTPSDQLPIHTTPRAVLRVANRGVPANRNLNESPSDSQAHELEPFLQDLQNDVARLSRAFATLGREANALVRSEAEMRARIENRQSAGATDRTSTSSEPEQPPNQPNQNAPLSRNARRRMRQRVRATLLNTPNPLPPVTLPRCLTQRPYQPQASQANQTAQPARAPNQPVPPTRALNQPVQPTRAPNQPVQPTRAPNQPMQPTRAPNQPVQPTRAPNQPVQPTRAPNQPVQPTRALNQTAPPARAPNQPQQPSRANQPQPSVRPAENIPHFFSGLAILQPAPPVPPPTSGPSTGLPQNGSARNRKKRRQRR